MSHLEFYRPTQLNLNMLQTRVQRKLDAITPGYIMNKWNVEYTTEFEQWWQTLDSEQQVSIAASVAILEEDGPNLGTVPKQYP